VRSLPAFINIRKACAGFRNVPDALPATAN
jgi:hypothetical protein